MEINTKAENSKKLNRHGLRVFAIFFIDILFVLPSSCHFQGSAEKLNGAVLAIAAKDSANNIGLPNLRTVVPGVYTGGEPSGEIGFEALRRLGVKTIISVDATTPDVHRSRTNNMRYVHLPVGYDTIIPATRLRLAKAVRDLPRPIYIHCHLGKHRAPTAAAVAMIDLEKFDNDEALSFMRSAGTSPRYAGLYALVRTAKPFTKIEIDEVPNDFPPIATVSTFVASMAQVGQALSNLKKSSRAEWPSPMDHPERSPTAVAARLVVLMRVLSNASYTAKKSQAFRDGIDEAIATAMSLEYSLHQDQQSQWTTSLEALSHVCTDCHWRFRD